MAGSHAYPARHGRGTVMGKPASTNSANSPGPANPASPPDLPRPLRLEVTSDTAAVAPVRRAVEAMAEGAGFDAQRTGDIGLAINEAMANVIRHAYAGDAGRPIVVTAECLNDPCQRRETEAGAPKPAATPAGGASNCPPVCLRIRIRDWGSGVNPMKIPVREHDPQTPGGLGLLCLRTLMDSVEFTPQPDGMLLTLEKKKC